MELDINKDYKLAQTPFSGRSRLGGYGAQKGPKKAENMKYEILSIIANFQLLGESNFYILRFCEKLAHQIYLNFGMLLNTIKGNQMEFTARIQ